MTTKLHFSEIEREFYRVRHEECSKKVRELIDRLQKAGVTLLNDEKSKQVLFRLQKLRQACSHPQVAGGIGLESINKQVQSMQGVLDKLIQDAAKKLLEAQKKVLFTENGRAGIHLLQGRSDKASEHYVNVIKQAQEMRADRLAKQERDVQRPRDKKDRDQGQGGDRVLLHALHNLGDILRSNAGQIQVGGVMMSAQALEEQADEIREAEIKTFVASGTDVPKFSQQLADAEQKVECADATVRDSLQRWLDPALKILRSKCGETEVLKLVHDKLTASDKYQQSDRSQKRRAIHNLSMVGKFKTIEDLGNLLLERIQELWEIRENILRNLKELPRAPSKFDRNRYVREDLKLMQECEACRFCNPCLLQLHDDKNCLRCKENAKKKGEKCRLCVLSDLTKQYQRVLYHHESVRLGVGKREDQPPQDACGIVALSDTSDSRRCQLEVNEPQANKQSELQQVLLVLKPLVRDEQGHAIRNTEEVLQIFSHLKKEHKAVEQVWRVQRERVFQIMELEKITTRLRLAKDDEEIDDTNKMYVLKKDQLVECQKQKPQKRGDGNHGDNDCCVPCRLRMLDKDRKEADASAKKARSDLESLNLIARKREAALRQGSNFSVPMRLRGEGTDGEDEVKGDSSTKIEYLVRELRKLPEGEKAIVFSESDDMLMLLSTGLKENGIPHQSCAKKGKSGIGPSLQSFKQDDDKRVLLMTFKNGCNGLNLTEATHVFLLEPILNVAVEAQAIGRVHRIGQKKTTTVHRVLVLDTVEESIHELGSRKMKALKETDAMDLESARAANKHNTAAVTLDDIKALFVDADVLGHRPGRGIEGACSSGRRSAGLSSGFGGPARGPAFATDGTSGPHGHVQGDTDAGCAAGVRVGGPTGGGGWGGGWGKRGWDRD